MFKPKLRQIFLSCIFFSPPRILSVFETRHRSQTQDHPGSPHTPQVREARLGEWHYSNSRKDMNFTLQTWIWYKFSLQHLSLFHYLKQSRDTELKVVYGCLTLCSILLVKIQMCSTLWKLIALILAIRCCNIIWLLGSSQGDDPFRSTPCPGISPGYLFTSQSLL